MSLQLPIVGMCQCGCENCTLPLTGYCICLECLCGAPGYPDYTHKIGEELMTDVDHRDSAERFVDLPGHMVPQRPVPGEDGRCADDASPGAQQETDARRTAVQDGQG